MEKKIPAFNLAIKKIIAAAAVKHLSAKEKIFLLLVIFILVAAGNYFFASWTKKVKKHTTVIEVLIPPAPKPGTTGQNKPGQPAENTTAEDKEGTPSIRNPFLPSIKEYSPESIPGSKQASVVLKVSGILFDEKVPAAIINSKVVRIGDIIYGKTIVDIEQDKVIVMEDGEISVLELKK